MLEFVKHWFTSPPLWNIIWWIHWSRYISRYGGLALEKLNLTFCRIGESTAKFAQAYTYMMRLKCLILSSTRLQSHHCEKLFDGFIKAGSSRNGALAQEELVFSSCEIGESVSKLTLALKYMPHLKKVRCTRVAEEKDKKLIRKLMKDMNSKCIVSLSE